MKRTIEEIIWMQPIQVKRCKIKNACFKCRGGTDKWSNMYQSKFQKENSEDKIFIVLTAISFPDLPNINKLHIHQMSNKIKLKKK